MGARHIAFAIDETLFAELIQRSLADVLISLLPESDHLAEERSFISWTSPAEGDISIRFHGQGKLHLCHNARCRVLEPADVRQLPYLSLTVRDFVTSNTSYQLGWFLDILARSRTYDFVRYLVDHLRRQWVFSLLESAEYWFGTECPKYVSLHRLCHKLLRLSGTQDELHVVPFPVIPRDDGDFYMGAWSADETKDFLVYCEELLNIGAKFSRYNSMSYPETDEGWDAWIRQIIEDLSGLGRDGYHRPIVIGFYST